jgi:hypothetical protein
MAGIAAFVQGWFREPPPTFELRSPSARWGQAKPRQARHLLRVAEVIRETPSTRTFVLESPEGGAPGIDYRAGQHLTLLVDTGCVVAYSQETNFEIQYVGKIKTALFGGEGLFFAKLTGPGTVWLQSLPFSRLASRVFAAAPQAGGRREEAALGGLLPAGGVLGGILGGDRE